MFTISPVTLTGHFIRLEPLSVSHTEDLYRAGHSPEIWKYMLYGYPDDEEKMRAWIMDLLKRQETGTDLPFAVIHIKLGEAVGATRFLEISPQHSSLEIGGTWYGVKHQRTVVNTECKYLLLKHAFEELGCIRVQLKTDILNIRSQLAIERIGAMKEGVFRNHMITPEGRVRDTVYYSIIDSEWPRIKERLLGMLNP